MKTSNEFQKTIAAYLEQRAAQDETFAAKIKNPQKSIDDCCNYILHAAEKGGCAGYTDDEVTEYDISHYWPELKICLRNNYAATDWQLWRDTIDALKRLGKDTHNAVYVCPKDLKAAHDRWTKLYAREQERIRIEESRHIFNRKQKFFDIVLKKKDITIEPLRTIEEYKTEGDRMHHCVYQMKYYMKKNTLILSAHTQKERLATIELSLNNFEILQCRAEHNKIAPREKEIVSLLQRNIKKFKKVKLLKN